MKIFKLLVLFISCMITFTSCIEINEKITFNKKGGGEYTIIMDYTKAYPYIVEAMIPNGTESDKAGFKIGFLEGTNNSIDSTITRISNMEGISDVEKLNPTDLSFGYTFHFDDISILSEFNSSEDPSLLNATTYNLEKKTFTHKRENTASKALLTSLSESDLPIDFSPTSEAYKLFVNQAKLTTEITFGKKIKNFESNVEIEKTGKKSIKQIVYPFKEESLNSTFNLSVKF